MGDCRAQRVRCYAHEFYHHWQLARDTSAALSSLRRRPSTSFGLCCFSIVHHILLSTHSLLAIFATLFFYRYMGCIFFPKVVLLSPFTLAVSDPRDSHVHSLLFITVFESTLLYPLKCICTLRHGCVLVGSTEMGASRELSGAFYCKTLETRRVIRTIKLTSKPKWSS